MVIVNSLTSQILKSQMETSFKDYFDWRRLENREEKLLEIRAIEFDNDEAYFLAGPVMFQGKSYGMAYFQHRPGCKPIAQQEEEMIESHKRVKSLLYMPRVYSEKFYKYLDPHAEHVNACASEFFFDPETKRSFSALDLRFDGAREIDHKVITRGRKHSRAQAKKEGKTGIFCGAFWTTKIAEERICEYIGKEAIEATIEKQLKVAHEINEENRNVAFCAERPYQLHLLGTDDASFTKTFETLEAMEKFAQSIKQLGSRIVTSQMTFTN